MKKVTIFSVICLLATPGIGLAREHRGMEGLKIPHGKWWRMPEVAKKLELTSEEQQKLDDLFVQSRRRMIDLKSNVEKEKLELETILDQQDFNESAATVNQAQAALEANETDLSKPVIRSPINGIVLTRNVEPGQTVAASLQAPVLL